MKEYGWRTIPIEARIQAIKFYEDMPETTEIERRDKLILQYFLVDNLCASAIARRKDPAIVCYSNKCSWHPQLSAASILRIIYKHCPYLKPVRNSRENDQRVKLMHRRKKMISGHIRQCAFCGNVDKLEEHHMIPLAMGGTNDDENLVFLCRECHKVVTQYQRRVYKCLRT